LHFPGPSSVACSTAEKVAEDQKLVYTAQCRDGFADVSLYLHDEKFSETGDRCGTAPDYCRSSKKTKSVGYDFRIPCSCKPEQRRLLETSNYCELQGGTLTATFNVPCNPGCGVPPVDKPIPVYVPPPEEPIVDGWVAPPPPAKEPAPEVTPQGAPICEHVDAMDVEQMTSVKMPMEGKMVLPGLTEAMTAPKDFVLPYWSDGNTVKFNGYQYWLGKRLSWVCFVWQGTNGDWQGKKQEGMSDTDTRTFEAQCDSSGHAEVYVYAHDGQIPNSNIAPYPQVCAGGGQDRTVGYKVRVPCGVCGDDDGKAGEVGSPTDQVVRQETVTQVQPLAVPPSSVCPVVEMTFNNVGLVAGEYITDKLWDTHGLKVKAEAKSGGFTPGGAARVFNTADPGTNNDNGE